MLTDAKIEAGKPEATPYKLDKLGDVGQPPAVGRLWRMNYAYGTNQTVRKLQIHH